MDKENELLSLYWQDNHLYILDQRLLPQRSEYIKCVTYCDVVSSICNMSVRGAPAIGISAAYGMAAAALEACEKGFCPEQVRSYLKKASNELFQARPTAVNLAWALQRTDQWLTSNSKATPQQIFDGLLEEADKIFAEDLENNRQIGANGAALVPHNASVLTHCNAGALATGGYGTALGVIRAAVSQGKNIHVYVDETRPLLQGARLTAFELNHDQIPATLITDSCAGYLMSKGKVDLIVTGADRIADNGDTANKIGTYSLAVLAHHHNIPIYVAAPLSTIDLSISSGDDIVIEERCGTEISHINNHCLAPPEVNVYNPAFDVTPAELITAIITECGIVHNPTPDKIKKLFTKEKS